MSSAATKALRINTPQVIFEEINGDVIAIHFDTGTYYNLTGTAGWVWQCLSIQASCGQIVHALVQRSEESFETVNGEISAFIRELLQESLIVESDTPAESPASLPPAPGIYASPRLNRFDDMQQLLLVDPIHEVGTEGWPHLKPA